ncbi:MAG: helix-turn-helix transcriptional regulator [Crocinitomicaceae bacterium]|nr:helix-turn-helix transcriptional regulator [Crocinitomicaceae bacterium]
MGATKNEAYTQQQIMRARFFKAISHPARIAALEKLIAAAGQDLGFNELFDGIELAQSSKSRHLKQLVDAGFVKTKLVIRSNKSCLRYRINKPAIEFIQGFLDLIYETIDLDVNEKCAIIEGFFSGFQPTNGWPVSFQT